MLLDIFLNILIGCGILIGAFVFVLLLMAIIYEVTVCIKDMINIFKGFKS